MDTENKGLVRARASSQQIKEVRMQLTMVKVHVTKSCVGVNVGGGGGGWSGHVGAAVATDGCAVGARVGERVGVFVVGTAVVGADVGERVVGVAVGARVVGNDVGARVVGAAVGKRVVGAAVGKRVGDSVEQVKHLFLEHEVLDATAMLSVKNKHRP
jgi:hypothetical protein